MPQAALIPEESKAHMIDHINLLRKSELFSELTEDELCILAPICADFVVVQDGLIFAEGRQASHLYVLTEGKVALQKRIRAPHAKPRQTTITICSPGEIFGWSALAKPYTYTLSTRAWESCRLIRIQAKPLRKALTMYPELGYKVMTALSAITSRRLRQTVDALISERQGSYTSGRNYDSHTSA